jgi:MoaA/NifB/PqqE/SkfB family radical SAM enzyme
MELQVSKYCFTCGNYEILWQVSIENVVAVNLTSDVNHTCNHCHARTIRLDSKVVDAPAMVVDSVQPLLLT